MRHLNCREIITKTLSAKKHQSRQWTTTKASVNKNRKWRRRKSSRLSSTLTLRPKKSRFPFRKIRMNNTRHSVHCKRGTCSESFHKATVEADDSEAKRRLKACPLPDFNFFAMAFPFSVKIRLLSWNTGEKNSSELKVTQIKNFLRLITDQPSYDGTSSSEAFPEINGWTEGSSTPVCASRGGLVCSPHKMSASQPSRG